MDATGGGDNLDSGDTPKRNTTSSRVSRISRQFWQAGEFLPELDQTPNPRSDKAGLDHARLHPRFLHSNATSHKWALGALVELLDNSMDEVSAGCNYVNVDKMDHPEDGAKNPVLLVEDNGGGMDDTTIRNCMSFGFSLKHGKKMIGQYGNGFKTSTMRLGADALVLTKSVTAQTCSIGLLSYTFLTETNSQDVVVPIIDYNLQDRSRLTRGDEVEWKSKMDIICEWGPFSSEAEIWSQLDNMPIQGTRVYIWNLWQTSDDILELDFDTDSQDIRLRGSDEETQDASNRKKRADEGIKRCHAYKHSLRAYVSLLYLEWPEGFQVTLRGKEIQPVPVTEGMKHVVMYDYRPRSLPKEDANSNELKGPVSVPVYIGFAIEAPETSVSGFCVYHRNRLIKPFWKVYASASSVGRGVIGFLQVDFVEPAHDKQDFENTPPLQKLEKYLKRQVPLYWRSKARLVGYQDHIPSRNEGSATQENSPNSKSAKKPATSAQPASGSLAKTEDPPDSPLGADTVPSGTNESFSERQKTRSGKTLSTGAKHSADQTTVKTDSVQKTVQKCFHEMQHQVSQLQQTVQDFCNKYDIKEDAQMVLGRIFGTTMSKVLDPAREMKRLHSSHLKTHRNVLQFIAESHANSQLKSAIPEFILTEMQEAGIQVQDPNKEDSKNGDKMEIVASEEAIKLVETNDSKEVVTRTPKRKAAPELDTEANQIETIHSTSAQMTIDVTAPAVITPEEVIPLQRSLDSHSLRKEGEPPPTRKQKTEQSNQELARLGLSVMEKYLKTKPNKMEIVQIQPGGSDVQSMEVMRIEDVEGKTTVEETIDCCTPDKLQSTEEQDAPSSDKEKQKDASIEPTS